MKIRHSEQFKAQVVAYQQNHPEQSLAQISAQFGLGHSTLYNWLSKSRQAQGISVPLSAEQARIRQLERENAHLREVNEIIKKAHVYFVNNPSK